MNEWVSEWVQRVIGFINNTLKALFSGRSKQSAAAASTDSSFPLVFRINCDLLWKSPETFNCDEFPGFTNFLFWNVSIEAQISKKIYIHGGIIVDEYECLCQHMLGSQFLEHRM